jgi:phosphate transport system substrate-binding protein
VFHVKLGRAVLVAALLAAPVSALAQGTPGAPQEAEQPLSSDEVRLSSPGLTVRGRVLGFDGRFLRVEAGTGELTVDLEAMACEGAACPTPGSIVPELRISGDMVLGQVLLPTLIEGFATAQGWELAGTDPYVLRWKDKQVLRLALRLATTEDGIADLLDNEADLALVARPLSLEEAERLAEAGLGGASELRLRPLAQGALVPAAGPGQRVGRITIQDLARVYAGEVTSWADLGGEDLPIRVHLGPEGSAGAQAFVAQVLGATGRSLSPGVLRHPDEAALQAAVAADPQALGILPFERFGEAQPLALVGQCRLPWMPRPALVRAGDYPLTVPVALLQPMRRFAPEAQAFVDFLATPDAQLVLRRAGVVGTEAVPVPWAEQGERLAAAIRQAGPEVPLRELQRLVRVLGPFTRLSTTFRFGSGAALDPLSRGLVLRLAHEIAEGRYAGRTLILAGFSDGRGAAEDNLALSLRRAEAVQEALLEALNGGLPEGVRLRLHAFGEALPIGCDGEGEGPWAAEVNRRVELWVSG